GLRFFIILELNLNTSFAVSESVHYPFIDAEYIYESVCPENRNLHLNNLPRTFFCAHAAVCTFICINMSQEVGDGDRTCLTASLAEPASDTADLAYVHQCFSFFVGITLYKCLLFIRNQLDQFLRTGSHAFAAGLA